MIRYRKLSTGEWVAAGPASEIKVGPVTITKRYGTCERVIDEVVVGSRGGAYGYLTEHCKQSSQLAADARHREKLAPSCDVATCACLLYN